MWALLLLFSPADGPPPAARRRRPAAAPPAEAAPSAGAGGYPAARWPRRSPPSAAAARTAPGGASGRTASGCIGATVRSPPPAAPAEARRCSPGATAPCGTAARGPTPPAAPCRAGPAPTAPSTGAAAPPRPPAVRTAAASAPVRREKMPYRPCTSHLPRSLPRFAPSYAPVEISPVLFAPDVLYCQVACFRRCRHAIPRAFTYRQPSPAPGAALLLQAGSGVAGSDPRPEQIQPHGVLAGRKILPGLAQPQRPRASGKRRESGVAAPQGAQPPPL